MWYDLFWLNLLTFVISLFSIALSIFTYRKGKMRDAQPVVVQEKQAQEETNEVKLKFYDPMSNRELGLNGYISNMVAVSFNRRRENEKDIETYIYIKPGICNMDEKDIHIVNIQLKVGDTYIDVNVRDRLPFSKVTAESDVASPEILLIRNPEIANSLEEIPFTLAGGAKRESELWFYRDEKIDIPESINGKLPEAELLIMVAGLEKVFNIKVPLLYLGVRVNIQEKNDALWDEPSALAL